MSREFGGGIVVGVVIVVVVYIGLGWDGTKEGIGSGGEVGERFGQGKGAMATSGVDITLVPGESTPAIKLQFRRSGNPITFTDFFALLREDEGFVRELGRAMGQTGMAAFFWETPPFTAASMDTQHFECVLVPSPFLEAATEDLNTFAAKFDDSSLRHEGSEAVIFENLGHNALLVSPRPARGVTATSLSHYLRTAPLAHARQFWRAVGHAAVSRARDRSPRPVWLSTSGTGVYYLHARLDDRPKYYTWHPYRNAHDFV